MCKGLEKKYLIFLKGIERETPAEAPRRRLDRVLKKAPFGGRLFLNSGKEKLFDD